MIENKIDISVIIINYNNCNLLKNCIHSLVEQTLKIDYEIIVVDNNSTECNPKEALPPLKNIRLIHNERNLGFAKANNQALRIANGEYVLFLNNDTIFIENTLKKVYDFAKSLTEPSIIGCKLLNEDLSNQISIGMFDSLRYTITESLFLYKLFPHSQFFNRYFLNYKNFTKPNEVDFVKGAFLFAKREDILFLQGFDERFYFYGEEVELCYRFKKGIGKVIYYPNTKIIHLGGATTKKNLEFMFINQTKAKIQFYQKHFSTFRKILAITFLYIGILIRIPIYFMGGVFSFNKSLLKKSKYYIMKLFTYPKNQFN